jgi:hypothetical protein
MPSLLVYLLVMVASGRGDNDLQVPPVTEASPDQTVQAKDPS